MSISAGGRVSVSGRTDLGDVSGSVGAVAVTGIGSWWTCEGDLYIGNYGAGDLRIQNAGSTWIVDGTLEMGGYRSQGSLNIEDGGYVSS